MNLRILLAALVVTLSGCSLLATTSAEDKARQAQTINGFVDYLRTDLVKADALTSSVSDELEGLRTDMLSNPGYVTRLRDDNEDGVGTYEMDNSFIGHPGANSGMTKLETMRHYRKKLTERLDLYSRSTNDGGDGGD